MASRVDGGVFVLEDHGTVITAVVLYLQDLLIVANMGLIGQIKDQKKKRIWMHDLGSVSLYLDMDIGCNQQHHMIDIHQHTDIRAILANVRMDESRPDVTPMVMKLHKRKPNEAACDLILYQSMIGSLMYGMTTPRPDIRYAIGVVSW
jgi:hypothetical protein